jgi:hypothetical protein
MILITILLLTLSNVLWQVLTQKDQMKALDRSLAQAAAIIVYALINAFAK